MTFDEKLISLDKRLRELRKEIEDDLKKCYAKGWLNKRKNKCISG